MFWIKEETIWFTEHYTDSSERVTDKRNAREMLRQLEHAPISKSGCHQLQRLHKELTIIFAESLKIIFKIFLKIRHVWEALKIKNRT